MLIMDFLSIERNLKLLDRNPEKEKTYQVYEPGKAFSATEFKNIKDCANYLINLFKDSTIGRSNLTFPPNGNIICSINYHKSPYLQKMIVIRIKD